MKIKILIVFLLFNSFNIYSANPGDLDVTYNPGGTQPGTNVEAINGTGPTVTGVSIADSVLQSDQKCVLSGSAQENGGDQFILLSRFKNDGTLDLNFNASDINHPGIVITQLSGSFANSVAMQSDQKIVIAGNTSTQPTPATGNLNNFIVARYDSNGDLDPSFGSDPFGAGFAGIVYADFQQDSSANSIAIQTDQKIIAGGVNGNNNTILMTRFNTDGSLDTSFGSSGLVQTQGSDLNVPDIHALVPSNIKLTSDEKILVCGHTDDPANPVFLAKYNNDGTLDTTFNSGGIAPGFSFVSVLTAADNGKSIVIQDDQKIVVGICAGSSGASSMALARFNADGTLDTTYGTNGKTAAIKSNALRTLLFQIAIQVDQKVVAVGYNTNGSSSSLTLARFQMDGTLDSTFIDANSSTPAGTINTVFNSGSFQFGRTLSIQDDQNIVAAADRFTNEILIARYLVGPYVIITSPTINETLNSTQPTITGRMQIGDPIVQVSIDGGAIVNATTINSGAGTWSYTPSSPLSSGSHIVQASTTDNNNVTSLSPIIPFSIIQSQTFVTITSPTSNEVLNNAEPTITGTMQVGNSIVQVSIDSGTLVNATTINSGAGTWSYTPNISLTEGDHTVQAFTTNSGGDTALTSAIPFSIDTSTYVTITFPTANEILANAQPTITGTMQTGNTIVQISIDSGGQQTATVNSSAGTWSFTPSASLADGAHTVQAFTEDPLGNTAQTSVVSFAVNSPTPVTITSPKNGQTITTSTPLFTGTTAIGNTIVILIDGTTAGFADVNSSGGWSFQVTSPLSNGVHIITIIATSPSAIASQTKGVTTITISITIAAATNCSLTDDTLTISLRNKYGQ